MYGYIYVTTNLINSRKYIGQHAKPEFDESYYGSGTALKPAIKKYGKENFICKAVDWAKTKEELDQKEIDWIDKCAAEKSRRLQEGSCGCTKQNMSLCCN